VWGAAEGNGWHSARFASPPANGARVVVFRVVYYFHSDVMPAFLLTLVCQEREGQSIEVGAEQPYGTGW